MKTRPGVPTCKVCKELMRLMSTGTSEKTYKCPVCKKITNVPKGEVKE